MTPLLHSIVKTLTYSDIFDYPLTLSEIKNFLIEYPLKSEAELSRTIFKPNPYYTWQGPYFFLKRRRGLIKQRQERNQLSQEKIQKAKRSLKPLTKLSWIKLMAVTGAVAAGNAQKQADIDVMMVVDTKRIWLVRALCLLYLTLRRKRVNVAKKLFEDRFCINIFLPDNQLEQAPDLYTANEIARMKVIWEKDGTQERFLQANAWIKNYLPNWTPMLTSTSPPRTVPQGQSLESLFNRLESWVKAWQIKHLEKIRHNKTSSHITLLTSHPHDAKPKILKAYHSHLNTILTKTQTDS